jgi:hypothetical protein
MKALMFATVLVFLSVSTHGQQTDFELYTALRYCLDPIIELKIPECDTIARNAPQTPFYFKQHAPASYMMITATLDERRALVTRMAQRYP